MKTEYRPIQVLGSAQANAYRGSLYSYSSCLTSAMGMGGGMIPLIVYLYEG